MAPVQVSPAREAQSYLLEVRSHRINVLQLVINSKRLRQEGIQKVKVVYSTEPSVKTNTNILGSVSYVPSVAGLIIASEVIKDIVGK